MVKVRIAQSAGFCMGVRKAMETVLDVSRGREVTYTLGPLVHNPQALRMLESRYVYVAKEIDESLRGRTVVIRAHGIPPETRNLLEEIGAEVVDGTCPNVLASQKIIDRYYRQGYTIVIIGDRGHAEIDALLGMSEHTGIIVENLAEAHALPPLERVCVVAQTTLNSARFREIADEVCRHAGECHVASTICAATERRQADVRKLARETDATVVVGGRNSANTNRLAEISRELGQPTFHVENPSELDLEELARHDTIGVTAGASTPHWVIQEVVDAITAYAPSRRLNVPDILRSIGFLAVEGNFVTCLAASAFTYAMCLFMSIPPLAGFLAMSFFYLFPMHTINKYLEISWKHEAMSERGPHMRRFWRVFLGIAVFSSFLSLLIAWQSGLFVFLLVMVSYLLGGLYSVRVIPAHWQVRFTSLRDIPGSKDLFIALAWTFALVLLPAITHSPFPGLIALAAGTYVFVLVFTKTTILALIGMQSDKLVGLETIPVLIGRGPTRKLLYLLNGLLGAGVLGLELTGAVAARTLILLVPVFYSAACVRYLSRKGQFMKLFHQLVLDGAFFLTGVLAYLLMR
ncbi:4-hydroxy-3-methylbut-2-enyl diphosphate reductase [Candidatus Latescibacterota bacterium]